MIVYIKEKYINLKNFKENSLVDARYIFNNVPDNIVICLNENSPLISEELGKKSGYLLDCEIKPVYKTDICFDNSNNGIFYRYEYQAKYYEILSNRNLINIIFHF